MKKLIPILCFLLGFTFQSSAQNAVNFDGNDDLVQTTYPGVLGSANRTFEAWVFVSSSAPASNLAIMDYGLNAVGSRNTFSVSGTRALLYISGGTNANISTPANSVPEDIWTHVAFVLDNGTGYFYVDGSLKGSGSLTTVNTPTGGQDVRIGQRVNGGNIPFQGSIDEVRVWDVARSATQIQTTMNTEFCTPPSNLQLYVQFNEGTAAGNNAGITNAPDISGNGNDGTLSNFTLNGGTSNWVTGTGLSNGASTVNIQQIACDSFSLTPNSTVYTNSGTYIEVFTNIQGCDSTVTLNLTINQASSSTEMVTACESFTWIDGITYTDDNNTATVTLTNANGCDSIVSLDLSIGNSSVGTDVQSACNSFTWIDGNTYTADNNTATFTLTNAAGCDSVVSLDLTLTVVNTNVIQNEASLSADIFGLVYQWVTCPDMTPINGETNQTFTATSNGDYAVIITDDQCSDTSACYSVTTVGTIENQFGDDLRLFPNPTDGKFAIDMGQFYPEVTVMISDLSGKQIQSQTFQNSQLLNVQLKEAAGVYLLNIEAEGKKAVIRLVKE